mmetsp:Transcript_28240/g.65309  ORF Transcript_28240/g.65309 Transcript_28240/m.65309 type:complete len:703 (-) Transcript_28240:40-2148(-)
MSAFRLIVAIMLLAPAVHSAVTPVEKVITLLENLESSLQGEGQSEATTYEEFACFCQNSTKQKSDAIVAGQSNIEGLSAKIQLETEEKVTKQGELADRKAEQEAMAADLAEEKEAYAKEKAEYEAEAAELSQALEGLTRAIDSMQKSKPSSPSFLSTRSSVSNALEMAEMMGFIVPGSSTHRAMTDFLQAKVDPVDPVYKFHSDNIISVMKEVLAQFQAQKSEIDSEFEKRTTVHDEKVTSLTEGMATNLGAMNELSVTIDSLSTSIASARSELVSTEALLKDDQLYLKDVTERCEVRAKEWDQRSQLRAGELEAISKALEILRTKVKPMDEAANERALLQAAQKVGHAPSFFQGPMVHSRVSAHSSLLEKRQSQQVALSKEQVQGKAMDILAGAGKKLSSAVLKSLVMRASADPFLKVKELIQQLLERLLRESKDEATKKGFCDTEMGKATLQRDYRNDEVDKVTAETIVLKAKREMLIEEIDTLNTSIIETAANLANATAIRGEEKAENIKTISLAHEGLEAVTEALAILKEFYKTAKKATVFVQKASPVDEDTAGAGFKGAYNGQQESADGIIGLLEVIKVDFERTIRTTTASEKQAAADFVEFDRVSKADMGGKSTKMTLSSEDLATTKTAIKASLEDLQNAQDVLDKAMMSIEALKPMCTDTTMPYATRVALREQEIDALKRALCILDTEGVEESCA